MQIFYSDSPWPTRVTKSLFLAGPSPRGFEAVDWKIEALEILKQLNFTGEVFLPVPKNKFAGQGDAPSWNYLDQIQWECDSREIADRIVFWVPRDIKGGMPGFTTNIEFGEDLRSGKIFYGRPDNADKCRYLDQRNEWLDNPTYKTLHELLEATVNSLGNGAVREMGEVDVPLDIWQREDFQEWYANLRLAGNRLVAARVVSLGKIKKAKLFSYTLHVDIWVESEQRHKANEFVFFRKSISSVVAYYKAEETYVVMVKEFRSPVNNSEGFVYELPSGSSVDGMKELENAQQELWEETGIEIKDLKRFKPVSKRQVAATLCSYTCSVYAVELSENEFNRISTASENTKVQDDVEHTYNKIVSLKNLAKIPVDYSTLGMIYEALG